MEKVKIRKIKEFRSYDKKFNVYGVFKGGIIYAKIYKGFRCWVGWGNKWIVEWTDRGKLIFEEYQKFRDACKRAKEIASLKI